jgi:hypothetical protein
MEKMRATSAKMDVAQLRQALEDASKQAAEQERYFGEIVEENASLEAELSRYKDDLEDTQDDLRVKDFQIQSLKDRLSRAGSGNGGGFNPDALLKLASRRDDPSPLESIEIIEQVYGDRCIVLESARNSAKRMTRFIYGRDLLDLLIRLVTTYRDALMDGGDSKARQVFGKRSMRRRNQRQSWRTRPCGDREPSNTTGRKSRCSGI